MLRSRICALVLLIGPTSACRPAVTEVPSPAATEEPAWITPRFAWVPGEFRLDVTERVVLPDGSVREDEAHGQCMVVRDEGGQLVVTFPDAPPADADPVGVALADAYGLLRLVLRPDGQIDRIEGFAAFVDAVAGKPGVRWTREEIEEMRPVVEATFELSYVMWVVAWLDVGQVAPSGGHSETRLGEVIARTSTDRGSGTTASQVRARFGLEGPVAKLVTSPLQGSILFGDLIEGEMEAHYDSATGYWQSEVEMDPQTLIPTTATLDLRLTARVGERTLTATKTQTTKFVTLGP